MKTTLRSKLFLTALMVGLANINAAQAASDYDKRAVSFSCVVSTDCATDLGGQLLLQVIGDKNGEDNNVYFKFFNAVGSQSSITLISFDGLADLAFLHPVDPGDPVQGTGQGTQFQRAFHGQNSATPDTLPAGNDIAPPFHESWTARAVANGAGGNGQPANGINADGEFFELIASNPNHPGYLGFLSAIEHGDIRVGLHVTALADGGSATYVTNAVPEPGVYGMMLAGLAILGVFASRRNH